MRVISIIVLVLCLSSEYTLKCSEEDFVDPLDMLNYDRSSKSMKNPTQREMADSKLVQNDRCTVFLSRFINILLINTGLSNIDQVSNDGKYKDLKLYTSLTLSVQDLELLKNMASKKDIDYSEIDRILSGLFTPEKINSTQENRYLKLYNQIKQDLPYWISIGFISIVLLYIILKKIHYVFSRTFCLFIIFALAFASTWYTMYMKAEINRSAYLENMPAQCHVKTGWSTFSTFSWFQTNNLEECKKYKEAILLDPKYSIAITDIFAEMVSKMMMKPLEALGESIYVFNKSVLKDIPYWAQIILIPIVIVVIIQTIFLSCSLLVGRSLSTKQLFGYGNLTIGSEPTNNDQYIKNKRINNSFQPMTSAQHTTPQITELPKVNFNINLFHPSPTENTRFSYDDKFKINYAKESNLIAMLKNKEIDSVDSKDSNEFIKKVPRHRTLSI